MGKTYNVYDSTGRMQKEELVESVYHEIKQLEYEDLRLVLNCIRNLESIKGFLRFTKNIINII